MNESVSDLLLIWGYLPFGDADDFAGSSKKAGKKAVTASADPAVGSGSTSGLAGA